MPLEVMDIEDKIIFLEDTIDDQEEEIVELKGRLARYRAYFNLQYEMVHGKRRIE